MTDIKLGYLSATKYVAAIFATFLFVWLMLLPDAPMQESNAIDIDRAKGTYLWVGIGHYTFMVIAVLSWLLALRLRGNRGRIYFAEVTLGILILFFWAILVWSIAGSFYQRYT